MSRDTFDAILASTPQGAVAGRITSRGDHWKPAEKREEHSLQWSSPPLMQSFDPGSHNQPNMTGVKFGRFTVLGQLHRNILGRARWVVRCACGDYEVRRTKSIRNFMINPIDEANGEAGDRCHNCSQLLKIKYKYRTEGARPIDDFFTPIGEST